MSYEFKREDAIEFFRTENIEFREHGDELEARFCPYCNGAGKDEWTFSLNTEKGVFNCLRSSCGMQGRFEELCRDFDYELDWGKPKIYRNLPQPKKDFVQSDVLLEFLKSRCISAETAKKYQLTTKISQPNVMVFPFFDEQGKLQTIKYRNMNFKKGMRGNKEWFEKDTMPILFGMYQCKGFDRLIITEGQMDALSIAECGIANATSVPNGAVGFTWIVPCLEWMNKFKEVIVFGDWERGKMTLLDTIKSRLSTTVKAVRRQDYLGEKDANDILKKYGKRAIEKAIENAEVPRIENIKELASVLPVNINDIDKIETQIEEIDRTIGGLCMGQVILLTGKRGDGKSTLMSQLISNALDQDESVFAYSGELADFHFRRWIDYQLAGSQYITVSKNKYGDDVYDVPEEITDQIGNWYRGRAFIFDNNYLPDDKDELGGLCETIERAIKTYNTRLICIDNLMSAMDVITEQNNLYLAQSNFVGRLKKIAMNHQVCIILVAHPRKQIPGDNSFDNDNVSGASDITNKVDVVMNYARATKADREAVPDGSVEPDSTLQISKNRLFGRLRMGSEDSIKLKYSDKTKRIWSIYNLKTKHYGWEKLNNLNSKQTQMEDVTETEEDYPFI